MSGMVRLGLFIPEDMDKAIKQESKKTLIPVSALVRLALERMLTERGYELQTEVEWGGNRQTGDAAGAITMTDRAQLRHTVIVQFRTGEHPTGWGSEDELDFRHKQEDILGDLLKMHGSGVCDGGRMGGGTMEIFFFVADIDRTAKLLMDYLTDVELIGFCKIASSENSRKPWTVHYPKGASFSIWSFDPGPEK